MADFAAMAIKRNRADNKRMDVKATIIVLAYNTPDLVLQCLRNFNDTLIGRNWQIIVVDNGSAADLRPRIQGNFDGVDLIRSERNRGFAAGNNLGLRAAKGEFVILMNSDIIARADVLEALIESMQLDPQSGAMSPRLLTAKGEPQAFAFGAETSPGYMIRRGMRSVLGLGSMHDWSVKEPIDVAWASAACLCVRRSVIESVGGLDERYPLYFEDADWCMRIRAAGWRVIYNPHLQVTHLGGASQPDTADRSELYYRSLLLFCEKHYGRGWKLVIRALLVVYRVLSTLRSVFIRRPNRYPR